MEHAPHIRQLLVRLIENDIDDAASRQLNRWLKEDPQAVRYYCEFLRVYAIAQLQISSKISGKNTLGDSQFDQAVWTALKEMEDTAPVAELALPLPIPQSLLEVPKLERHVSRKALAAAIISMAALVLLICLVHFFPAKTSHPVASLTGSYNALWSGDELMPDGSRLWNDDRWYGLERGKAEVTFDSGAAVLLEAPVRLKLLSKNRMHLEGALTARVPESAHGFTVDTAHSKIVDLGTEFGVFADAQKSRVLVRRGEVELHTLSAPRSSFKQRVNSGEGYQVDRSGTVSEVPFQAEAFRWDAPDTYEQAVYQTRPLAYWRFDQDRTDRIVNEMNLKENEGLYQGQILLNAPGPNLGSGKPNYGLRLFGRKKNSADAIPAGFGILRNFPADWNKKGGYSIALWFRPEALGLQSILVYSNDNASGFLERYSDQIYLDEDNRPSFYVYCPDSAVHNQAVNSISASEPVRLNTWYHVAVTCSADNRINLYVNGQSRAVKQLPSRPESNPVGYIGCASVNPYYDQLEHVTFSREPFCGTVDEISQYDRMLSSDEIESLYRAAAEFGSKEAKQ